MKYIKYLLLTFIFIPFNVFADTIPMDNYTEIDNLSSTPKLITINANSSVNKTFYILDELNLYEDNFNYFGYTICSNALIQIKRRYSAGSNCNQSCYSNDMYLQLVTGGMLNNNNCTIGNVTNGYQYYWYYGATKWEALANLRYIISDQITITNLGNTSANVYFYNAIAFNDNPIPNLLTSDTIIDKNNQNTQDIIDNANENTQDIIDSNKVCNFVALQADIEDKYLGDNGSYVNASGYAVTPYINIFGSEFKTIYAYNNSYLNTCFYNANKKLLQCYKNSTFVNDTIFTPPNGTYYVRTSFYYASTLNAPIYQYCNNGNQSNQNAINDVNNSINDMNSSASQSSIDGFGSFFDDFQDPMPSSVTDILLAPLNLVGSISNQCSPVTLNVLGKPINLPCGTDLFWERQFSNSSKTSTVQTFRDIWNVLFGGSIIYALLLKLWSVYESLIDPTSDAKIEHYKVKLRESKKRGAL